jgi:excisionase family DNA binding protein
VVSEEAPSGTADFPEVAALFGVDPTATVRWAHDGLLRFFTTPGGHYRFRASDVD